jgi:hypothetical protein
LWCGGGEVVAHSRVLPSHGSLGAFLGERRLMTKLMRNTVMEMAMRKAPAVETEFQSPQP